MIFAVFLILLNKILQRTQGIISKEAVVILDNASTHWSNQTRQIANELDFNLRFLPPYWPEVAPVDIIFGALKSKLRAGIEIGKIKLNKLEGMCYVLSQLKKIKF